MKRKALPRKRDCLRLVDHQTSDGVGFIIGQRPLRHAVKITDGHGAINREIPRLVCLQDRRIRCVELIGNLTHNFLKDIFKCDQPLQRAIFIHNQGKVGVTAQKLAHLIVEGCGLGHKIGFHRDVRDVEPGQPRRVVATGQLVNHPQQVFGMDHANNILLIILEHRQAGVGGSQGLAQDRLR